MSMDELDEKLNATFDGKVLRKDLLHRIKKGTNVPTFVLEFLFARYCASNDPAEIQAGMEAVLSTLQENYVRPDEANSAQSRVAMKGNACGEISKSGCKAASTSRARGPQTVAFAQALVTDTSATSRSGRWTLRIISMCW